MPRSHQAKSVPALIVALFTLTVCSAGVPAQVKASATVSPTQMAATPDAHEGPMFQWEHEDYAREEIRQMMGTCLFFAGVLTVSLFRKSKDRR